MGELRLGHIESDNEVSALLARTFANCRRSLLRGIGPADKAAELQLRVVRIPFPADDTLGELLQNPLGSYVVAEAWLLREIELANIRIADVFDVTGEEEESELAPLVHFPADLPQPKTTSIRESTGGSSRTTMVEISVSNYIFH